MIFLKTKTHQTQREISHIKQTLTPGEEQQSCYLYIHQEFIEIEEYLITEKDLYQA